MMVVAKPQTRCCIQGEQVASVWLVPGTASARSQWLQLGQRCRRRPELREAPLTALGLPPQEWRGERGRAGEKPGEEGHEDSPETRGPQARVTQEPQAQLSQGPRSQVSQDKTKERGWEDEALPTPAVAMPHPHRIPVPWNPGQFWGLGLT